MKRIILITALLPFIFASCTKNVDELNADPWYGISIDTAEDLTDELSIWISSVELGFSSSDFKPTKDNLRLDVLTSTDFYAYRPSWQVGSEEHKARLEWKDSLYSNGLNKYFGRNRYNSYTYAGVAEGARIYADRQLWGRKAGEDLGDMFSTPYWYNDIIVSYPEFNVLYGPEDKYPETFREYTSQRIALSNVFATLKFVETPPEELDSLTLTIEIPIDVEYYNNYTPEMYEKYPSLRPEGRRLLKGTRTIVFDNAE